MDPQRKRTAGVIAVLVVLGLTAGLGIGLVLGWVVWPVDYKNTAIADLSVQNKEEYLALVAGAYAVDHDLDHARARLDLLEAPNIGQWLADLIDRYIAEGRNETDTRHLAELTHALGFDTPKVIAYLPTPTPGAGTNPSASGLQYNVAQTRLLSIDENGGCEGRHSLLVRVLDANENPLDGVLACAYWALQAADPAACQLSQTVEGQGGGWIEFTTYRPGEQVYVASDTSGDVHLSSLTPPLEPDEAPVPWLVAAGYCADDADCQARSDADQLCAGHYTYVLVFQRTW